MDDSPRGIPRNRGTFHKTPRRHRQGPSNHSGQRENWRSGEGTNSSRRHRTASTSSQRHNDRTSNFENHNQNRRFSDRFSRSTDNLNDSTNRQNQSYKVRPIGFKALESLLEKDSDQLLLDLSNSKRGLKELVQNGLKEDSMILFVRILKKVVDSSFEEVKYTILQKYLDDNFVDQLKKYILYLVLHNKEDKRRNRYFWNNPDEFWNNLIAISRFINDTLPSFGRKVLPEILKSLVVSFPTFEVQHSCHIADEIKENVNKLNEAVQELVKQYEEIEKENIKVQAEKKFEEEPPDDFREISVYPSSLELTAGIKGFLRKNVVKGPYKDVNHYLDVQFRLLREDFVGPLRDGIASFRSGDRRHRIENIKIHRRVKFLSPETVNEQYCVRLRFDFSNKKKNFKYENSKRLIYGSLLCFTFDDFRSIIFGKVSERKIEDLEKGEIIVGFDQNVAINYNVDYLMVECGIYFEPYYHVLNVLKTMSTEIFPMEKYIIHVDPSVEIPEYLRGHRYTTSIATTSSFNESQRLAFEAALNQEFCIIQGPPGTGKTYLGLKIAKVLLASRSIWYKQTPMLVICYTNHALDQFLEGITQFTQKILRIGGQSKNEKLKDFNLRNQSKFKRSPALYQQRNEVQVVLSKIKNFSDNLKQIELYHSIRDFGVFDAVIPDYRNTWFCRASKSDILSWLLDSNEDYVNRAVDVNVNELATRVNNLDINMSEQVVEDSDESDESDNEEEGSENENVQVDDIFDEIMDINVECSFPLITLTSLETQIKALKDTLMNLKNIEAPTTDELIQEEKADMALFTLERRYNYLNMKLVEGKQQRTMIKKPPEFVDLKNPHVMSPNDRWKLYFYWLDQYKEKLLAKQEILNREFREAFKVYEEMRDIENTNSMKNVLVVGMTTTGAARLRSSLQALKCPIVIVEEAAEVLEAHIISSLTKDCKHLILIGDHQQLKPSTANYEIEKFYNLGISLFERMVINKIQLHTLNIQHRMRPEISSLITPTIYPALEDHSSVMDRPLIKGLDNCLYFIDHTHKEQECDGTSKKNLHEVHFLIHFAKHLILNGYKPENITILAAYLGQMFEMQKEKRKYKHILGDMRIAVLDNYQGEECDIILLSLVRSNDENKIGFLSIENRVCVALSRARNGFYIMGNMTQLCSASELWRKIRRTFEQQNAIGSELALRCQIHTDTITYVEKGDDFLQISEGGCNQMCRADLVCGHQCTSLCHILDRDHQNYRCMEPCKKRLCEIDPLHLCKKMCFQECGPCTYKVLRSLDCGHDVYLECHIDADSYQCITLVRTILPCGHLAEKPCHRDKQTYRCPHPCEIKVEPCGHACEMLCHVRRDPDHLEYKCKKRCAKYSVGCTVQSDTHLCRKLCYEECEPCTIMVKKQRTICPHVYSVPCSYNVDQIVCEKPCTKILSCGHKCKSKCSETCGKCEFRVEKLNPVCQHPIKVKCCEEPNRKLCTRKCPLKLACGHFCTTKCNEPCTTNCEEIVECSLKASCGHRITRIPCWVAKSNSVLNDPKILLKYCNNPCSVELGCSHICSGTCGECHQGRIHKRCNDKCGFTLICNHPCDFPCREACRPCGRRCEYKCKHSSCGKKCGEICTPCKEKCTRGCKHQKCTRFCGDICNILPCELLCEKILKCGHPCIGYCGDPCPTKCLVCDKDELTTILFGNEDEEDARFVMLNDCGHIFESEKMLEWMNQNENQISIKVCPQCKTPIRTTQRYSDFIKKSMADITNAKRTSQGSTDEITKKRNEIKTRTSIVSSKFKFMLNRDNPIFNEVIKMLEKRLEFSRKGRRQAINKFELDAVEAKLQVIEHISNICNLDNLLNSVHIVYFPQITFIIEVLMRDEDCMSNQEIDDIQYELNRLARLVDFGKIKKLSTFQSKLEANTQIKTIVHQIEKLLFGIGKFSNENEKNVTELLKNLSKLTASGIGISETEKREIVKAMGFKQGHWYKCPNGHPYVIADCGGAMVESRCPECKAKIGGTNHRLLNDNAVATEMDGARFGAWSEAANMANYRLD